LQRPTRSAPGAIMIGPEEIATAQRALGAQLAQLREAARLTQVELAARIMTSRSTVANIETGHTRGTQDFWTRADETLNAKGQLLRGHADITNLISQQRLSAARRAATARSAALVSATRDLDTDTSDAAHWCRNLQDAVALLVQMCALDLSRRSFLRAAPLWGAALVGVERDWLLDLVTRKAPQTHDAERPPAVVAAYAMIGMLEEMDNRFGGGHARLAGVSYLSDVVLPKLSQTPDGPELTALLVAAAQLTSNIGWMSYDCVGFGLGQKYMTQALRLCAEAGDRALAGQIFAGLSHLTVTAGRPAEALNLAEVGLATAVHAGSPLGTMRLHAMRARAHAALHDSVQAARALCDAEKAIDANTGPDDARGVRYLDEAYLTAETAHCFSALADHDRAGHYADMASQRMTGRGRRRTLSLTVLATSRLERRKRDLDGALEAGEQALDELQHVSSGRCVEAIHTFQQRLIPYRGEPAVRQFNLRAGEILRAGPPGFGQ
jgi:transcriptional regulator with XRE-family HTH domain